MERFFRRPGTGHSPLKETETQLPDQQQSADSFETALVGLRDVLTRCVVDAAHQTLAAIHDRADGARTGQIAEIAYAYACLEGARRGAMPSISPPYAPAAAPPAAGRGLDAPASRPVYSAQPKR